METVPTTLYKLGEGLVPCAKFETSGASRSLREFIAPAVTEGPGRADAVRPGALPVLSIPHSYARGEVAVVAAIVVEIELKFSSGGPSGNNEIYGPSATRLVRATKMDARSTEGTTPPDVTKVTDRTPCLQVGRCDTGVPPSPLLSVHVTVDACLAMIVDMVSRGADSDVPDATSQSALPDPP